MRRRSHRRKWRRGAYPAVMLSLVMLAASMARWDGVTVSQGGSFTVAVEGTATDEANYLGLVHKTGRASTLRDVWTVLTSNRRELGPLDPASPDSMRPLPGDESTSMGSSLAVAWIAANKLTGVDIAYTKVKVVDHEQEADLDELGIEAGAPVVVEDDGIRVFVDGEIVAVSAAEKVQVVNSYRVSGGQPGVTVGLRNRGSSAGLVFGLAYLDHLTAGDLSGGLTVAGTGVLNTSGLVYSVSSDFMKVQAALAGGADVVFIPYSNFRENGDALSDLVAGRSELVPVGSLLDAVMWLCAHGGVAEGVCPAP